MVGLDESEVKQTHSSTFPIGLWVVFSFSLYVSLGYISAITIAEIGDSRAVRAIKWQEEV